MTTSGDEYTVGLDEKQAKAAKKNKYVKLSPTQLRELAIEYDKLRGETPEGKKAWAIGMLDMLHGVMLNYEESIEKSYELCRKTRKAASELYPLLGIKLEGSIDGIREGLKDCEGHIGDIVSTIETSKEEIKSLRAALVRKIENDS